MEAFELSRLARTRRESGGMYLEFLKHDSISMGLYELTSGGADPQLPHTEDEVYVVQSGAAMIRVGDEDRAVGSGSIVFVAAGVPHRFHSITEDLSVLVLFAPAEYSRR